MIPRTFALRVAATLIVIVWNATLAGAQPPSTWDPVSAQELALARPVVEPDADAEALFWRVWVEDSFATTGLDQTRDYYVRIKIFNDRGARRYQKIDIEYPLHGGSISGIAARTIQPDGTTARLAPKNIAGETVVKMGREGIRRRSFAVPKVEPGCIIEYRYHEYRSQVALHYETFQLQLEIPVHEMTYYISPVEVPDWYLRWLQFHSDAVTSEHRVGGYFETSVVRQPAYESEADSPPEFQQRGWMLLYYTQDQSTDPASFWRAFSSTEAKRFDDITRPDRNIRELASRLIGGAGTDLERAQRLSEWVQREFRVVGSDDADSLRAAGLKKNKDAASALRQKGGTHWDADVAFAALARSLGIETRLLRVPSRQRWFFDQSMMSGAFVESFQIALRLDGGWECFDPGTRHLPWDMVPWDEEGQFALFCDEDSARFIETRAAGPLRSRVTRSASLTLSEDGTLEGDLTFTASGHLNSEYRSDFEDLNGAAADSTLRREWGWDAGSVKVTNVQRVSGADPRDPLRFRCRVRLDQHATVTGKRLILEPSAFHAHTPARFTSSLRRYPVYMPYSWSECDTLRIRLPDGWALETLDPPGAVSAPGVLRYEANMMMNGERELVYIRELWIGDGGALLVPVESYPELKKVFDHVQERDRATATFVRAHTPP